MADEKGQQPRPELKANRRAAAAAVLRQLSIPSPAGLIAPFMPGPEDEFNEDEFDDDVEEFDDDDEFEDTEGFDEEDDFEDFDAEDDKHGYDNDDDEDEFDGL